MEMNLADLVEQFGSNDRCREYLEHLRWPEGVECPRCGSKSISRITTRKQFDCNSCRKRFSVLAGTVFQDSKLPLWKWFAAIYLICESKKGISALQIKRMLKIGSYETAWFLCHRIRAAMENGEGDELLGGIVEADETWIGGRRKGRDWRDRKSLLLGAVERDGQVRIRVETRSKGKKAEVHGFLDDVIAEDAEAIYTDEWHAFWGIETEQTRHETVDHTAEEWVRGDVHTQTIEGVWSLFKRGIVGSYHHLSAKHLPAYVDEMEWRYNNRENPYLFRDTLLRLIEAETLTYKELIAA
jgi:transposase-like protein